MDTDDIARRLLMNGNVYMRASDGEVVEAQVMFDLPAAPPTKRAKTLRELDRASRASMTRYVVKERVPCDECILLLSENDGRGPYARSARWKASFGGRVLLLCNEHAEAWRTDWQRKDHK